MAGGILCRQKEIDIIKEAMNNIHTKSSIITISGPAGVGKVIIKEEEEKRDNLTIIFRHLWLKYY